MKKNYLLFAAALMALASCSSDDFIGNNGQENVLGGSDAAIRFDGGTGKITRAVKEGEDAANLLGQNFVVFGYKTTDNTKAKVYDHYNVNWLGKDKLSESNKEGWEYVNQTISNLNSVTGSKQTIKYWDYSASKYDFVAFSFGSKDNTEENQTSNVTAEKVTGYENDAPTYSLKGTVNDLAKCYIADKVTATQNGTELKYTNSKYNKPVTFNFRSLASKVKLGIYEIIPGYSIKDVKFYDGTENAESPALYIANSSTGNAIPAEEGTMKVSFNDDNTAKVAWTITSGKSNAQNITWKSLSKYAREANEDTKTDETEKLMYIGRESNAASTTDYQTVLPGSNVGDLTLKVDFTLVSTDGSGETINVIGASAVIPAKYTDWQPNYAYTYIFKISDKTNGSTGGNETGLYPITFDAVVTETTDGKQETITEIDNESITTYSKGEINKEYVGGSNIYISVKDNDLYITYTTTTTGEEPDQTTTTTRKSNCELYKVEATDANPITEANVASVIAKKSHALTVTKGKDVPYTNQEDDRLKTCDEIPASDTVDGHAISGNFVYFKANTPENDTPLYYAFEYTKNSKKYYKVIKVVKATK